MSHTHIHIIPQTNIKDIQSEILVIEVIDKNDLVRCERFNIEESNIDVAIHNLSLELDHREKSLTFACGKWKFKKVIFFFPEEIKLMDDRSTFFQHLTTQSVFIPSKQAIECHECLVLGTYRFQEYLSVKKKFEYEILVSEIEKKEIEKKVPLYTAIIEARDLVNEPPSNKYPEKIVEKIRKHSWKHFDLHIFDSHELKKLGCNLLLAVWIGSDYPPYMVVLVPKNPPKWDSYALIGKGVTFDAGGIQIKPDTAMLDMKCDMSGAAGMLWTARYLDTLDTLPANVIFAFWITENMTGGRAYKPLDIYTAFNGTTVEIHHTDAEGRLVLADVMSYVEKTYHVDHIITMATLTGACIYALGYDIAGIMWDDEDVISTLIDNRSTYEPLWRLPFNDKIKKSLKADIADLKNITRSEKAGSSLWWAFLSYFQGNAKLTHLDIAWPAYRETTWWYMPKWWTGWGVRILSDFLLSLSHSKKWKSSWKKSQK